MRIQTFLPSRSSQPSRENNTGKDKYRVVSWPSASLSPSVQRPGIVSSVAKSERTPPQLVTAVAAEGLVPGAERGITPAGCYGQRRWSLTP